MKVKAYIHAQYNEYEKTFTYSVHYCDMQEYGYTLLETRDLEVEQPSFEQLANKTIKALRDKQSRIRATAQAELDRVDRVVDTLLYIEHKA